MPRRLPGDRSRECASTQSTYGGTYVSTRASYFHENPARLLAAGEEKSNTYMMKGFMSHRTQHRLQEPTRAARVDQHLTQYSSK